MRLASCAGAAPPTRPPRLGRRRARARRRRVVSGSAGCAVPPRGPGTWQRQLQRRQPGLRVSGPDLPVRLRRRRSPETVSATAVSTPAAPSSPAPAPRGARAESGAARRSRARRPEPHRSDGEGHDQHRPELQDGPASRCAHEPRERRRRQRAAAPEALVKLVPHDRAAPAGKEQGHCEGRHPVWRQTMLRKYPGSAASVTCRRRGSAVAARPGDRHAPRARYPRRSRRAGGTSVGGRRLLPLDRLQDERDGRKAELGPARDHGQAVPQALPRTGRDPAAQGAIRRRRPRRAPPRRRARSVRPRRSPPPEVERRVQHHEEPRLPRSFARETEQGTATALDRNAQAGEHVVGRLAAARVRPGTPMCGARRRTRETGCGRDPRAPPRSRRSRAARRGRSHAGATCLPSSSAAAPNSRYPPASQGTPPNRWR